MRPLPETIVVTDRRMCSPRPLVEAVRAALSVRGAKGVLLREKDLPAVERAELASELAGLLRDLDGLLLVGFDGPPPAGWTSPAGLAIGFHLSASADRAAYEAWRAVPATQTTPDPPLLGRSCHDAEDVHAATAEGCDYVTFSPIFASSSKPGYGPAHGVEGLRSVCADTRVPVIALGGVTPATAASCIEAGAAGVAMMGAAMREAT